MFLITFGIFILYTLYHLILGVPILLKKNNTYKSSPQEVSIVACQYNEENNLPGFMESLLIQRDTKLEILIIDDQSTDESFRLANSYSNKTDCDVKVFRNKSNKGKKSAQKLGFNQARHNMLLLTDVDCRSNSPFWASGMLNTLEDNDVVIGHAPFFKNQTWLNKLQRYDNVWIAYQYMGFALNNAPYMGVGRNMAIKKSTYEKMKHNIKGEHLKSGDDDLLVQALRSESIGVQLNPQTFMFSDAESNYSSWLRQKKRQITTSTLYARFHQIILSMSAFLSICTPLALLSSLILSQDLPASLLLIGYLFVLYGVKGRVYSKLEEPDLIVLLPILEVMYSLHLIILSIFVFFKKSDVWK